MDLFSIVFWSSSLILKSCMLAFILQNFNYLIMHFLDKLYGHQCGTQRAIEPFDVWKLLVDPFLRFTKARPLRPLQAIILPTVSLLSFKTVPDTISGKEY